MEPNRRRTVCRPHCAQDWDVHKAQISEVYGCMSLDGLMKLMEEKYFFKATKKQYKTQFSKWNLRKNTTAAEYKAMIRKKRKRQRFGKARSAFRLRGAAVEDSDIIRFQKRKKILDDDDKSDVHTPSSLSCYTPTRDAHSRSSSLAHDVVPSSPTPKFEISGLQTMSLSKLYPIPASIYNWDPEFDEYIDPSAVGAPTQSYQLSLFISRQVNLDSTTYSPLFPITTFDDLDRYLDRYTTDRSTVNNLQARADTEQQRTQAIELQALTNDRFDHFQKRTLLYVEPKTNPALSECYDALQSLANPDQAGLDFIRSFLKRLLDSKPRSLLVRVNLELLSGEKSMKELNFAALSHRISNSDTNDLQARTPCLASSPASSSSRSSYQRAITEYSGLSDPTLSEAAEWHELMES